MQPNTGAPLKMGQEINNKNKLEALKAFVSEAKRMVVFTGAGTSTASGIPDYRGVGVNYWNKYNPKDFIFEQFLHSEDSRKEYWRMDQEFYALVLKAVPNQIHYALAQLERRQKLCAVVTQNVDSLYQKAGLPVNKVIEIHGNISTVTCLHCYRKYPRQEIYNRIKDGVTIPYCNFCHGILKPDTVLFGQPLPQDLSQASLKVTLESDLFMAIGSSLLVQPASYLVLKAKEAGAKVIIINLNSTPYDIYADLVIYGNAEEIISYAVN